MQYDVKSAFATGDGAMANFRTRIKGVFYAVATPGDPLIFHDNASAASGEVVLKLPASVAGQHTVGIPGEGILCENGVFVDIGGGAAVTLIYG
jgi:hypothetical protein